MQRSIDLPLEMISDAVHLLPSSLLRIPPLPNNIMIFPTTFGTLAYPPTFNRIIVMFIVRWTCWRHNMS